VRSVVIAGAFACTSFAYLLGIVTHKYELFPYPEIRVIFQEHIGYYDYEFGEFVRAGGPIGFNDAQGRREVECRLFGGSTRAAVIMTLGQSNAANSGETRHVPGGGVYNFNFLDGKCYEAKDPLLGASGTGGSVWTRLADKLVDSGEYDTVVLVPLAVGSSSVVDWAPAGKYASRVTMGADAVASVGLKISHVLWHQGELDASRGMSADAYVGHLNSVIVALRDQGVDAPFFVAIATLCNRFVNKNIAGAQMAIVDQKKGIFPGPNTDLLDRLIDRYDYCHLSDVGLEKHGAMWLDAITEYERIH
jgi:hypothetical protein